MKKSTKILNILSFGYVYKKANKNNVYKVEKIKFDYKLLIEILAGKENIDNVLSKTRSSFTILVKDIDKVDTQQLKKMAQNGLMVSKNLITIIDKQSLSICNMIKEVIKC